MLNKHVWSQFKHEKQESQAEMDVINHMSGSVVHFQFRMGQTTGVLGRGGFSFTSNKLIPYILPLFRKRN